MQATADENMPTPAEVPAPASRRRIASHAAAALAAVFSAAIIVQASLDQVQQDRPVAAPTSLSLGPAAVAGVLNAAFTPDGVRNVARYPMEFEAILGPTTTASLDLFAQASWPARGAIKAAAAQLLAPATRRLAQGCPVSGCRSHQESGMKMAQARSVLPPARPVLAMPSAVPMVVAEADPVRTGLAKERRLQFLGVKLPGFVPNGHAIVSTVLSWGGTVADLVPRI